ncbi:PAN domain-containing protein [Taklimakanibacter deserti]|uniref:PAN domain-containing protein n=1 Tax=Taklimakanibacter deserti TaxID=2267839 RepID=UPI0013C4E767
MIGLAILFCHQGLDAGSAESAEIVTFTPKSGPAVILVRGELAATDGLQFMRKTDDIKEAVVRFESPGGMVIAGLGIGRAIQRKGFATVIPSATRCTSACALAWLGGAERFMAENARIGFHRAYVLKYGRPRTSEAAEAVVLDYLQELRLPQRAITYITGSPPQGLHMLTMGRARDLGIAVSPYGADIITASADEMPAGTAPVIKRLPQVDLYGRNLPDMPIKTKSADECEGQCTAEEGCAAFTFNTARSACFLKASAEIAVSHPAAVSGLRGGLKKRIRRTAMAIQEATDYPGNDIDRQEATTFEACLISCSGTRACKAFTYVVRRHECWLKNGTGSAERHDGLVSGVK